MSQYNNEGMGQYEDDPNWNQEQTSLSETQENNRFLNKIQEGFAPDIVR